MEQRRSRRFQLELPLSITRAGSERVAFPAVTKNISSCGVLFTIGSQPEFAGPIEYVIALGTVAQQQVNLRCVGKVLRSERSADARRPYAVAATLERYEFIRDSSPIR